MSLIPLCLRNLHSNGWIFMLFYSTCLKNVVHGLPNQSFKRPRLPRAAYLKR